MLFNLTLVLYTHACSSRMWGLQYVLYAFDPSEFEGFKAYVSEILKVHRF
jgi:hypothetical protein